MNFNLSALAVRERSITLFLIIAMTFAGAFAFMKLGRAEDPSFSIKILTIVTAWPGATAQEMQDQVAEPLEKRMQELKWYDRSETFTRPGLAFTTLTLKDQIPAKELQEQFYQTRKKMADEAPNLPRGVLGPFVNDEYGDVSFALYALKAKGEPQRLLVRQAETLRQRLLHVPGVKKVQIVGEQPQKIFVEFSQARLATLGVSPRDLFAALNDRNLITPAGAIETQGPQVQVRLDGAIDSLEKIKETPIVVGGRTLKLGDIAEVKRGYEDPATFLIRNGGEPAIVLSVVMKDRFNGLELGKNLEKEAKAISAEMPLGMSFSKITDQAVNIAEAYGEFMLKFFVALAVVIVVSLISLGFRVGVVVAMAVPLTLAGVFVIMLVTGRDFDRITLGALILSLGLLVDDAIIIIETIVVKMEEGKDRISAATYAWGHTAAPMLAGTLVTIIGLMPVGFAQSSAGEYAGNIFWVVAFALITSWFVAVIFTPYLGVLMIPKIKPIEGGHAAIYDTPRYRQLRSLVTWTVDNRFKVAAGVGVAMVLAVLMMGGIKQQFFPLSDRPEVLIEVQMPEGQSIGSTSEAVAKVEAWLAKQPEAEIYTSYIGQGAPRFFLAISPELPDPSFAKIVVLTPNEKARDALKNRFRQFAADGSVQGAKLRATQIVFGPPSPFPVAFRVMGPNADRVREIAERVKGVMLANQGMRQVNTDWGERAPTVHFVLDQDRLRAFGLSSTDAAQQLQFLLTGVPVTQVREDIRTVDVLARTSGQDRLDPARLGAFTLVGAAGQRIPLDQIGKAEIRMEDPILRRRDRMTTITVRGDIDERLQPPDVSTKVQKELQPIIKTLPAGYRIEMGGSIEEAGKANKALAVVFPLMFILMMVVIIFQVRSLSAMWMVLLTAPLALVGVAPTLLIFHQPFGFNAILGLIALAGIIMRNSLILIGQIQINQEEGLDPFHAVVEATVQRARPVILTALAAVFAFIPLTLSVFWSSMAYTLIGGTIGGTILTLVFLPALYAMWFKIKTSPSKSAPQAAAGPTALVP
ncbi:efflux RND transporter permease subunit [Caulobacter vibrioides]|uniref:AcrB/AcrD/AcrF family protein n=2 Tax=Caulobacter vibrioides TaxID=155892 RepID=Q9A7D5_CAUVC|nr:efflux RND transporter permease subunit [Caulobacter vibrioides]YP_002517239.1 cation/multidrug efflux pump acrB4 [Caulobacter vibrioides NA1000]AAK23764.1 AcrB/AcrD/AcrF family protein [Caulobacter vibrioides CB15]ACL95331.1 cation/multidrug efflux pump acrB4 [Caulobacter vibrioides NA1000]ATC28666.1 AcrB/AcrD/AcrF family protein [Caulobacter vibrioides]AZH12921.1 efflux RND transporter permease subunit [Caulobacter vibrioides]QXZ53847.1 efflux RND transporter permease subunit [Caulobacte